MLGLYTHLIGSGLSKYNFITVIVEIKGHEGGILDLVVYLGVKIRIIEKSQRYLISYLNRTKSFRLFEVTPLVERRRTIITMG